MLNQVVYNAPYGTDMTQTRISARGRITVDSSSSYVTGGLLPNFNANTGTLAILQDQSGQNVLLGTYTKPTSSLITGVTVSGTTCTFLTANPPTAGQYVTFGTFAVSALIPFNGITAKVASVTAGTSFVCTITTTATTATGAGQATLVIGPDEMFIETISGSGYTYKYNKANATVQVFQVPASSGLSSAAPLVELPASTVPSAVANDVVHFYATWAKE